MPQFLKQIIDLAIFRGHPQHLPGTMNWLIVAAIAALLTETLLEVSLKAGPGSLLANLVSLGVFAGLVWLLLRAMSHRERWVQTMIGIFGVHTLIYIITIPFARAMDLQIIGPAEVAFGSKPSAVIVSLLILWSWLVTAHVLKLATGTGFVQSLITITIFMCISVVVVLMFLQGLLPAAPVIAE